VPDLRLDWDLIRKRLGIVVEKPGQKIDPVKKPKLPEPDLPLAATSTGTIAGSAERIAVYRQRAERGESIFHPHDCKLIQAENLRCHAG
jgi:hypothetical protein